MTEQIKESVFNGLRLSNADKQSDAWLKVLQHLRARREDLRVKVAGDLDSEQTWKMRGRIAELTALIDANADDPVVESEFK